MRAGLAVGLGAGCLGLGAIMVARSARAKRRALPLEPDATGASGPAGPLASERALPTELSSGLADWVAALAAQPVVDPEAVTGAALFAQQLAQAGFAGAATALRKTIEQATAAGRPDAPDHIDPAELEHENDDGPRSELWVDHYLGGWQTAPDMVQTVIRDVLDHLAAEDDGYVRSKPSEWDALQAGESAGELERLGYPILADGVRELVADAQHLPERKE